MTGHHDEDVEAFAAQIEAMLKKRRHLDNQLPPFETLIVFAADVQLACRLYLRDKDKYLRPSLVAKKMASLANHLRKAAALAELLGPNGMLLIHAASHAQSSAEDADPDTIPVGLARLSRDVDAAVELASDRVRSGSRHREGHADRGGPTPNEPLRQLVRRLAVAFNYYLKIRPRHVANPDNGKAVSLFDEFAENAFVHFCPDEDSEHRGVFIMETRRIVKFWDLFVADCDATFYGLPAGDRDMND